MSLFYRECPCCGSKFNKLSLLNIRNTGCEFLENHKCYYCNNCKKRISKAETTSSQYFLAGIIFVALLGLSEYLRGILNFFPEVDNGLLNIPFLLIGMVIFQFIYMSFIKFDCYDDTEKIKIPRDNSDIFVFNNENIRIDESEKNVFKTLNYVALVFVIIAVLLILFK